MEKNEKRSLIINRAVSFVAGALLVFAVMSFTVVKSANAEVDRLTQALDTSRFEAGRLLDDANAQLSSGDYAAAEASLTALFANQPGSEEAVKGQALLTRVQSEAAAADDRWEAALPAIRQEWVDSMAADLRAEFEEDRAKFESDLEATINKAWDKAKADVRDDWNENL